MDAICLLLCNSLISTSEYLDHILRFVSSPAVGTLMQFFSTGVAHDDMSTLFDADVRHLIHADYAFLRGWPRCTALPTHQSGAKIDLGTRTFPITNTHSNAWRFAASTFVAFRSP